MTDPLFELNPPEVFVDVLFWFAGREFRTRHFFRPSSLPDWLDYDARLKTLTEDFSREYIRTDSTAVTAACWLWEKLARRQEGYERLPFIGQMQKLAAIRGLAIVQPAELTEEELVALPFTAEEIPIALSATRSGVHYPRLVHYFRTPTAGHQERYERALTSSYIVKGAKRLRIMTPGHLATLTALYRELALRVEGYAWDGQPYCGEQALADRMEAQHQRAAIETLLGGISRAADLEETEAIAPFGE